MSALSLITWANAIFFLLGLFSGFLLIRLCIHPVKTLHVHQDATIDTLDLVLRLDRALYADEGNVIPGKGDAPHIGLRLYKGTNGLIHVDNRHSPEDRNNRSGASAGEALLKLQSVLQARIDARRAAFARAEDTKE